MSSKPLVSVVITCFNDAHFLPEAILSVEACRFESLEILVVNDGSTEVETLQILEDLSQNYTLIHQANQGASAARNTGIAQAKGDYIIPLDADNLVCPTILLKGTMILDQNPEIGMVYGDKEVFGEHSFLSRNRPVNLAYFLYHQHIDTCAIYRKRLWADVGGYDVQLPSLEDWMFWLEALHRDWKFHYEPEVFFRYRYRSGSKSRRYSGNPVTKLALTEYFYHKKEQFLEKSEQKGLVKKAEAQTLRIKWTFVLAVRNWRLGKQDTAWKYLKQSIRSGSSVWHSLRVWAGFISFKQIQ